MWRSENTIFLFQSILDTGHVWRNRSNSAHCPSHRSYQRHCTNNQRALWGHTVTTWSDDPQGGSQSSSYDQEQTKAQDSLEPEIGQATLNMKNMLMDPLPSYPQTCQCPWSETVLLSPLLRVGFAGARCFDSVQCGTMYFERFAKENVDREEDPLLFSDGDKHDPLHASTIAEVRSYQLFSVSGVRSRTLRCRTETNAYSRRTRRFASERHQRTTGEDIDREAGYPWSWNWCLSSKKRPNILMPKSVLGSEVNHSGTGGACTLSSSISTVAGHFLRTSWNVRTNAWTRTNSDPIVQAEAGARNSTESELVTLDHAVHDFFIIIRRIGDGKHRWSCQRVFQDNEATTQLVNNGRQRQSTSQCDTFGSIS